MLSPFDFEELDALLIQRHLNLKSRFLTSSLLLCRPRYRNPALANRYALNLRSITQRGVEFANLNTWRHQCCSMPLPFELLRFSPLDEEVPPRSGQLGVELSPTNLFPFIKPGGMSAALPMQVLVRSATEF